MNREKGWLRRSLEESERAAEALPRWVKNMDAALERDRERTEFYERR